LARLFLDIAFCDVDPNGEETGNELKAIQRDVEMTIDWELPAPSMT